MSKHLDLKIFQKKFKDKIWWLKLQDWFASVDAYNVYAYLGKRSKETTIFPKSEFTFEAFNKFDFKDLKIVFIGEFSWGNVIKEFPWDKNITKETNLDFLAEQGILFLKPYLTWDKTKTHDDTWESFFKHLFQKTFYGNTGLCFILQNESLKKYILPNNHICKNWEECNNILLQNNGPEYMIEFSKERRDFQKELNKITPDNLGDCPF